MGVCMGECVDVCECVCVCVCVRAIVTYYCRVCVCVCVCACNSDLLLSSEIPAWSLLAGLEVASWLPPLPRPAPLSESNIRMNEYISVGVCMGVWMCVNVCVGMCVCV